MGLYNFFNFTSFYALGAYSAAMYFALAFKLKADNVYVWIQPAFGAVIGVAHQVTYNRLFIADCTYICHVKSFHKSTVTGKSSIVTKLFFFER